MDPAIFLKFIRHVIEGETGTVRSQLKAHPALATVRAWYEANVPPPGA